jgi:putative ABC transport system permease protein
VKETPGVSEAAVINLLPVREFFSNANFSIRGRAPSRPGHEPAAEHRVITPGYFRTMGIPLVSGRYFNDEDMADTPRVSIINQRAAEMYWPGKDPVGEWIAIGSEPRPDSWMRIVGVVSNVRHAGPYRPVLTAVYLPACHGRTGDAWPTMNLVVRHHGGASATLAETIRSSIRELDPAVAVYLVKSMSDVVSDAAAGTRLLARMMSLFSALAVVLAVVGVYGVMSYIVTQRTHEIGVRMALGAGRVGMVKLVMARGLRTAGLGVCLGMSATVPLLMVTRHYLVGIDVTYVWTYAIGIVCTVAVAVGATVIPAWHASRVDPVVALRDE